MPKRRRIDEWTDDELLVALQARDAGWTCKQIGQYLGRTRGSVIGALHRTEHDLAALERYWAEMDAAHGHEVSPPAP